MSLILKKITLPILLIFFIWLLLSNEHAITIIAGIALFLIGMNYMEKGFKLFSGGMLETSLEKLTKTTTKAIATGFVATSLAQSSSLVTVIIISFLSAGVLGLTQAVGIMLGSNIGTTTTAWIVSSIGVNIDIDDYALPMLIFGVVIQFFKYNTYKGFGNILIGLAFIFLGIDYMKDGFEVLKESLDLSSYTKEGYLGIFIFILFGAVATVIIQSSSATMALIVIALATGQIDYISGLALAIGTNIGTTVTAAIGAIASNRNGKRLAVAHFIFNSITALFATIFIYQLIFVVDKLAAILFIAEDNYAMKLALFHTLFNVIGVLLMSPFIKHLVNFIKTLFKVKDQDTIKAKYLTKEVMQLPSTTLTALRKESIHLYELSLKVIVHGINLNRSEIFSNKSIKTIIKKPMTLKKINIEDIYQNNIKQLYSEILHFSSLSQENMNKDDNNKLYELRFANRSTIEVVKDTKELQKNLNTFLKSDNKFIIAEYNKLRLQLVTSLRQVQQIKSDDCNTIKISFNLKAQTKDLLSNEKQLNKNIDTLIRENKINPIMASSLLNDIGFTFSICKKLLRISNILWVDCKA